MSTDFTATAARDPEPIPAEPIPTEPDPTSSSVGGEKRDAFHRILLEALARESDGAATLRHVLAHAPLSADQKAIFELFASLGEKERAKEDPSPAPAPRRAGADAVDSELADLRVVNDTCAAALGACRVCWGGDTGCPVCGGRGRAGFALPDVALFKELVVPAISRLKDLRRATDWMSDSRDGRVRQQWRR